jgi:Na+/H+ antiporter NhaD/arsenite permease-like protein
MAVGDHAAFAPPVWTVAPFVLLLLGIALLPLVAEKLWHANRNKALVVLLLSVPVALYLVLQGPATNGRSLHELLHALSEYASFIILLAALYVVAGGIVLDGDLRALPTTNAIFLGVGCVLGNLIGTTGASMLLIRPVLRVNRQREHTRHLPVFFIFLVSNLGGLITPLGDPPLFLGFLRGIDFFWTFSLWPHWLVANGAVLAVFLAWDTLAYRRESPSALRHDAREIEPLRVRGLVNLLFLGGLLLAVLFQSERVTAPLREGINRFVACPDLTLRKPAGELVMIVMAGLSWWLTPTRLRVANAFTWSAIVEVAVLFLGIFVTMVPALALLSVHGPALGVTQPWQYFWLTGGLSSFLDNAPTYLTFATLAAGEAPEGIASLATTSPRILAAISCGAVFMGANTYVGNGPNFMVKAIADAHGYRTPSFFGYMVYSGLILVPLFAAMTPLFFR